MLIYDKRKHTRLCAHTQRQSHAILSARKHATKSIIYRWQPQQQSLGRWHLKADSSDPASSYEIRTPCFSLSRELNRSLHRKTTESPPRACCRSSHIHFIFRLGKQNASATCQFASACVFLSVSQGVWLCVPAFISVRFPYLQPFVSPNTAYLCLACARNEKLKISFQAYYDCLHTIGRDGRGIPKMDTFAIFNSLSCNSGTFTLYFSLLKS